MTKVNCFCSGITFPNGEATNNRIIMIGKALVSEGIPYKVYINSEGNRNKMNTAPSGKIGQISYHHFNGSMQIGLPKWRRAFNFYLKGFVQTWKKVKELSRDPEQCIYLYSHGSLYNAWVSLLARWHGVKVVQEVNEWTEEVEAKPFVAFIYKKVMFRWAQGAMVISDNISTQVNRYKAPKSRLKTILLPVLADRDDWAALPKTVAPTFVWCGLIEGYFKDVAFMIKAFAQIHHQYPTHQLVICGKYKLSSLQKVEALCDDLGMPRDRVKLTGFISDEELQNTCLSATALVSPLWDDQRSKARFPTKISGFLFSGRPVLTCDVGEVGKYLTDCENALFFDAGNTEMLAEKMELAIKEPELSNSIGQQGRILALEKFDYRGYGPKLSDYFASLHHTL